MGSKQNKYYSSVLFEVDCFCSGLMQSMVKMMKADAKSFFCYLLWMIMLCQIIQSVLF